MTDTTHTTHTTHEPLGETYARLWAVAQEGPLHTAETCLVAAIIKSATHGDETSHAASKCSTPPPTLCQLLAQSNRGA